VRVILLFLPKLLYVSSVEKNHYYYGNAYRNYNGKDDCKRRSLGRLAASSIGIVGASFSRKQSFRPLHQDSGGRVLCDFSGEDRVDVNISASPRAVEMSMSTLV
jgi:hypothetical protein